MKKYYYIGIRDGHGYTFITQIDRTTKTFFYNKEEKPLAFTNLSNAEDMLLSIRANGFDAILIADPKKLEERFVTPHFLSIPPIHKDDKAEFVGRIIDVFEDFLDEKNIHIPNSEREDYYSDTYLNSELLLCLVCSIQSDVINFQNFLTSFAIFQSFTDLFRELNDRETENHYKMNSQNVETWHCIIISPI